MTLIVPSFPAPPTPVAMLPTTTQAAVWFRVPTDHDVAFITIDDGYPGDSPALADQVQAEGIAMTPFLTYYAASSGSYPPSSTDPVKVAHVEYLRKFTGGKRVGSHSKTHTNLTTLSQVEQGNAMENARNWLGRADMFGQVPILFRPPYGAYNQDTLTAAAQRGHPVVVMWSLSPSDIITGTPVQRGDILSLHFTTNLEEEIQVCLDGIAAAGLTPAWIQDYVR